MLFDFISSYKSIAIVNYSRSPLGLVQSDLKHHRNMLCYTSLPKSQNVHIKSTNEKYQKYKVMEFAKLREIGIVFLT